MKDLNMKTLNTFILSILCATSFFLHSSTHEELLRYDLSQRKATQKLVKTIRNVTGTATLLGLLSIIYMGTSIHIALRTIENPHLPVAQPSLFAILLAGPVAISSLSFIPSLVTFIVSTLYNAHNNLQIEVIETELKRLIHTK